MRFDIDRYVGSVAALDTEGIDLDAFAGQPLDPATLRCLRAMHDVEHHTICYLRDLLVTRAHDDPVITTFLTMWAYEEFWHGEALAAVLAAHGERAGRPRIAAVRARRGDRATTLGMMAASACTEHVVTVALTWGAVNEWTTQAGYLRLASRSGHPVLAELLRRIAKQEGRHIDLYATEASRRLAASPAARRATRWALRRRWRPVGSGVLAPAETRHLVHHLFGDAEGAAMVERVDARIHRLPGLDGLHLVGRARSALLAA